MPYTPILATLGYVMSPDRKRVLMVHRNRRANDAHLGKYNGLGGKLEANEDIVSGIRREIREESGIESEAVILRGTISWPGFGKGGEDWFGFIFRIDRWHGEPFRENEDGPLEWVEIERVLELPMWEGDSHFVPMVLGDGPVFHGVMPYRDGRRIGWTWQSGTSGERPER
jgi:8-oxo-dGTP diphosphatase